MNYDNEGAFAQLSLETLHGPGLWIPLSAARKIHSVCIKNKKRLAEKDKEGRRNHYKYIDTTGGAAHPPVVAVEPQHEGAPETEEQRAPSESTAISAAPKNRADARREWEAEVIKQKKAEKEEAALIKAGKLRPRSDALKQHSEELAAKIAAVRQRCAQEDEENAADFDEVTSILYASYQRLRETNRGHAKHLTEAGADSSNHPRPSTADLAVVASSHEAVASGSGSGSGSAAVTGSSPSRVLRALRTSASSASFTVAETKTHTPGFLHPRAFCCAKHAQVVLSNREAYCAHRRVQHALELQALLERIPSAEHGFVTSHSLQAIAARYLEGYRGMPARSADPALVTQSVEGCRLDLHEQRRKVLCAQPCEVLRENLASVLPVVWYCPRRFAEGFVDLLEELDRERLDSVESAYS